MQLCIGQPIYDPCLPQDETSTKAEQRKHEQPTVYWKTIWFIYSLSEGYMVHLRSVRRPYGSFTARWKAVRLTLWTVSRTYGQLKALFGRQHGRYLGRDFLCIFMFYSFISCVFLLYFSVLLKQLRRLYIGGSIFKYH